MKNHILRNWIIAYIMEVMLMPISVSLIVCKQNYFSISLTLLESTSVNFTEKSMDLDEWSGEYKCASMSKQLGLGKGIQSAESLWFIPSITQIHWCLESSLPGCSDLWMRNFRQFPAVLESRPDIYLYSHVNGTIFWSTWDSIDEDADILPTSYVCLI